MRVRGAALVSGIALLAGCGGRALQPGRDAGPSDAGPTDAGPTIDANDAGRAPDTSDPIGPPGPPDAGPPSGRWTVFATLGAPALRKIWGSSDSDIWVVGSYNLAWDGQLDGPAGPAWLPRFVHYDGAHWRDVAVPGTSLPDQIWGLAANDIWATGASLRHFDGSSWREVPAPGGTIPVWGAAADDVWFGSEREMLHWNGSMVATVPSPPIDTLLSIWGFSTSDVWAGGGSGGLMHWDGRGWSLVATGNKLYVYGLWGARPDDVWGVGNGGNRLHWNGTTLTAASEGYTSFEAITGTGPADIWGVGECCWDSGHFRAWLSHYDGSNWTAETFPDRDRVTGIWVSPTGTYYAVAGGATVLATRPPAGRGGYSTDPGASPACVSASDELVAKVRGYVDSLQADGGPCTTVLDCKLFAPAVECGNGYNLTGCPTLVAQPESVRIALDKLQSPQCGSIAADPTCRGGIFVECPAPFAACQSGRCTSLPPAP